MDEKHPAWTRTRIGRNRFHWVAYDDRFGSDSPRIVDQGYATSLPEADTAARSALAEAGMFQARRMSTAYRPAPRKDAEPAPTRPARPKPERPREYLYTRRTDEVDDDILIAAHLILKKTPRKIYVTRKSFGADQVGSEDEAWSENEPGLALDRPKLEQDGSIYSAGHRSSDFFTSRDRALGDAVSSGPDAARRLGLHAPFSVEDIKVAYRRKALAAHPDRGGQPGDFQAIEVAYRRLLREAQATES